MCFRKIFGWFGRRVGWTAHWMWDHWWGLIKWTGILLIVIIGTILNAILTGVVAVMLLLLKGFAWITYKLMVGSKDFGMLVGSYTETFFDNVYDQFQDDEEAIKEQIYVRLHRE